MIFDYCDMRQRGFTLAEAMLAVVVLGIAAAGILLPFSSGARVRAEGMRRTLAAKLAGDLMEQITAKPFEDPNGETAGDFDDIDDFDGYEEAEGQIKDSSGTVFTDLSYARFGRSAECKYAYVPQESELYDSMFILVTVRVYYSGDEIVAINRLVGQ